MSFMLVTGKIYRCQDCAELIQVEYEGGATWTQVSDQVIGEQSELIDKFGQPTPHPEATGYYLFEEIVCESCHANRVAIDPDAERIELAKMLLAEIDQVQGFVVNGIVQELQNPTDQDIISVIGEDAFKELGSKSMLPTRRIRRINELFQPWHASDWYIGKLASKQLKLIPNGWAGEKLVALLKEFQQPVVTFFYPKQIWLGENLNPLIEIQDTVRFPVESTPHQIVYLPYNMKIARLRNMCQIRRGAVLEALSNETANWQALLKKAAIKRFVPSQA